MALSFERPGLGMVKRTRAKTKAPRGRRASGGPSSREATVRRSDGAGPDRIAGVGDAAVRRKTGRGWTEWLAILDRWNAAGRGHRAIAAYLHEERGLEGWWAQTVTVGYEQARGLRAPHQTPQGFEASASRTIGVPLGVLYEAWQDERARGAWLGRSITVRRSTPAKSMRITWEDGRTHVTVGFYAKGVGKSMVAVQHSKLSGAADVERKKKLWGAALDALKRRLES